MTTEALPFSPVSGIRLAAVAAGIRYKNRDDLLLLEIAEGASCAAVFTRNQFCAAPVHVARRHLAEGTPRYLLINSGNANAGTGRPGMEAAIASCQAVADRSGCDPHAVLPFSTGVIGEPLPVERIAAAIPAALAALGGDAWPQAARAIMTTDTVPKLVSRQAEIDGKRITITGIAKGSGMIRPDMATMLAYIATDANLAQPLLQRCLSDATGPSFNSITVDGDTSTNDACVLIATGASGASRIESADDPAYATFSALVLEVCMELARAIVKDGEGATKLIEIRVDAARDLDEARAVAFTIAHSPLVKTALFASDPNWGRILAAVGRAGVEALDIERVRIWLDDTCIVRDGGRDPAYTESAGQAVMSKPEILIRVDLGRGEADATVLTCDLSFDYVKINAEYRT